MAAPLAGQILGDLGADVVKVEQHDGDECRRHGPSFVRDDANSGPSRSSGFISVKRNKRSILIDFARADGSKYIDREFKVGGLAKYGLDHERLLTLNPELVYLSVTGFGPGIASPLRLAKSPIGYDRPLPGPGEHSDEVLRNWLGIGQPAIDRLRAARIII